MTGIGRYLPERVVSNDEMATMVDTSDAWITERSGIKQRHFAAAHETASFMAAAAARGALAAAGVAAAAVDAIIVATSTPDTAFPATAVHVQAMIGAKKAYGFDLAAACSGFVYAVSVADAMIRAGQVACVLVIGSEVYSRILNFKDRGTCVLFGDGAGAVVLEPGEGEGTIADRGILGTCLRADGTKQDLLYVDGGPSSTGTVGKLRMQGNQVFRHAVVNISDAVIQAAAAAGVSMDAIDWFIPHQANQRILEGVARRLGIDSHRVISTVAEHANTSAASIPLAMAVGIDDGRIKPGQLLLLEAMGGGLTWGAVVLRL
jgi:3-oxoacyl-[acyl-carrier-protein] synthase-3